MIIYTRCSLHCVLDVFGILQEGVCMQSRELYLYLHEQSKHELLEEIRVDGHRPNIFTEHAATRRAQRSLTNLLDTIVDYVSLEEASKTAFALAESIPVGTEESAKIDDVYSNIMHGAYERAFFVLNIALDEMSGGFTGRGIVFPSEERFVPDLIKQVLKMNLQFQQILTDIQEIEFPEEADYVYRAAMKAAFHWSAQMYQKVSADLCELSLAQFMRLPETKILR